MFSLYNSHNEFCNSYGHYVRLSIVQNVNHCQPYKKISANFLNFTILKLKICPMLFTQIWLVDYLNVTQKARILKISDQFCALTSWRPGNLKKYIFRYFRIIFEDKSNFMGLRHVNVHINSKINQFMNSFYLTDNL